MVRKILVIDDDIEYVEAISALLKSKGYDVIGCTDVNSGFAAAMASAPDAIILDVMMPYDSEGLDMVARLSGDPVGRSIPVILVTGIQHSEDLPIAGGSVRATLEKPVKPNELLSVIERCFT